MAAIYEMRIVDNGEQWRFRTKLKVIQGSSLYKYSPYLWSSKEDATYDEPLFRYLKDKSRISPIGKPKIPNPPQGNEWFVTIKPNDDWQEIRDYLESEKNMVTPSAIAKRKYSKTKDTFDETHKNIKRNKIVSSVEVVVDKTSNVMEIEITPPNALIVASSSSSSIASGQLGLDRLSPSSAITKYLDGMDAGTMRKSFTNVKPRRQLFVQGVVVNAVKLIWKKMSPQNSLRELQTCLTNTDLDVNQNTLVVDCIKNTFENALKSKDKELMIQILSIFTYKKEITITKLSNILGFVISYGMFRSASHHAQNYGPGVVVENYICPRNEEKKINIIEEYVSYLIGQGNIKFMFNIMSL